MPKGYKLWLKKTLTILRKIGHISTKGTNKILIALSVGNIAFIGTVRLQITQIFILITNVKIVDI